MGNKSLHLAKKNKKDEFYTLYSTIEDEMKYYAKHFKGKIVYCNCDDYRWSNFVKYFKDNYHKLELSGLYTTNYDIGEGAYKYYYDGFNEVIEPLKENGSYNEGIANNVRWIGDFPCLTKISGNKIYNRILIKRKQNNESKNK